MHVLASVRRNTTPCKRVSAETLDTQNTRHGARPGSGMRRNVPVARLLAPQRKAREKVVGRRREHAPLPKVHF